MAETIFALSSGPGPCGVAVFRASGPGVPQLVQTMTRGAVPPPRQAVLRSVFDPRSGELIDRGLVLYFSAPHSFTGEHVAEFHLHGAVATIRGFTAALMALEGTRLAEPGEFTQRAFRFGKMSLLEVEALGDLLRAETLEQARLAQRSHHLLARAAAQWREEILTALALTEASIDFSDEDDVAADIDSAAEQHIRKLISLLDQALAGFAHAERIRR
ncbi:MAG: tRNA uridine-5-carboxymethylaminomethyl(34) synthesis GTPase MnmE, partial [Proteobacteria bacterium]|nr:tRNA uridine-5-carboxymethylaminomethyl(34) synthesis GTPase MnmE [Pseudomonadota bacterium]